MAIVPRLLDKKEVFVSERFLRLCSSSLIILFDGHFMIVFQSDIFKPLTPGTFCKIAFFDILVIFRLDLGQITFDPVENAFATQQLDFLATSIAF